MDIITVLKEDHRNVEDLFQQIESASDRAVKTKEKLFAQLATELSLHAAAEEQILYPRVEALRETRGVALKAGEEHRLIEQLLRELTGLECGGAQWVAKLKVLKDMVERHVREEETEMLPELKSRLQKPELRALGDEILTFKRSRRGGKPFVPPAPVSAKSKGASSLTLP